MSSEKYEVLRVVSGEIEAEIIRGYLEANDIPVLLVQEGAGRAIGLSVGPLGEIHLSVPTELLETAKQLLADYDAGRLEQFLDDSISDFEDISGK